MYLEPVLKIAFSPKDEGIVPSQGVRNRRIHSIRRCSTTPGWQDSSHPMAKLEFSNRFLSRMFCLVFLSLCLSSSITQAEDWPMWRFDAARSGCTTEELPQNMKMIWTVRLAPPDPAWPEDPRLMFDARHEPVIWKNRLLVASSSTDSVTAYDTSNGKPLWRFDTEGPVRFAPVLHESRAYFGSDDGNFYCLNIEDGSLLWKFRAAPSNRKAIGNERLISVWPIRGGAVLKNGKIYFTSGVWPFEGTFLYILNAESGEKLDAKQIPPHGIVFLRDQTPEGYLAANDEGLFIPCGRSVVSCQELETGKTINFNYSSRGTTNYHVSVDDRWLFHGLLGYDMSTRKTLAHQLDKPIHDGNQLYGVVKNEVYAWDLKDLETVTTVDRRGRKQTVTQPRVLWKLRKEDLTKETGSDEKVTVHFKAGDRIYCQQGETLFAIQLPLTTIKTTQPVVVWKWTKTDAPKAKWHLTVTFSENMKKKPVSMIGANGKLYLMTENRICCFAAKGEFLFSDDAVAAGRGNNPHLKLVKGIVETAKPGDGYCLVSGLKDGNLIEALMQESRMRIIGIDSDAELVQQLRDRFHDTEDYGSRVALLTGEIDSLGLPPYFAHLVMSEKSVHPEDLTDSTFAKSLFHVLRPYGGTALLEAEESVRNNWKKHVESLKLPNAVATESAAHILLVRRGALVGSANWTHEYGDPSNSLMSQDRLVKAPLGVLWFGGPSSDGSLFYNRHYWGPSLTIMDGRMFIQGPAKMTAVDVYTGRLLWQIPLDFNENYNAGRRGNDFEKVLAGFHFLTVKDGLYLVLGSTILRIDPANGKILSQFRTPNEKDHWGRIRVQGDDLIATIHRNHTVEKKETGVVPREIVVMDRHTGKVRWSKEASISFPVIAVGRNRIFCYDSLLEKFFKDWGRKGVIPKAAEQKLLRAYDLKTGEQVWQSSTDMIVTWISYSPQHDVLVTTNQKEVRGVQGGSGKELWKREAKGVGFRGHPESLWDRVILWNDQIIDQRGPGRSWNILNGEPIRRRHPITNELVDWEFTKSGHHCNYAIANPHLLTFRAASAGFCDITTGNTSRLNGFRPGCRNSLIPANGILNAPNFAHGCSCGYSLFTSLALVHLPEMEVWSYNAIKYDPKQRLQRIGINFGAPGDRQTEEGTLWLDHPSIGGSSPSVPIGVEGENVRWFRRHAAFVGSSDLNWIAAYGVKGAEKVTVPLGANVEKGRYTVRLIFWEPDEVQEGERVFHVEINGKRLLTDFDLKRESTQTGDVIVKSFEGIASEGNKLTISLEAVKGETVLSGVEVIRDNEN